MDFKKVRDLSFQFSVNMKSLNLLQDSTEQKDMRMGKNLHGTAVPKSALSFFHSFQPPAFIQRLQQLPSAAHKCNELGNLYLSPPCCTPYSLFL